MPLDLINDKSTLVQIMAWCRQATSHCRSQCWPRFLSPYGVTRPQWVNEPSHLMWWLILVWCGPLSLLSLAKLTFHLGHGWYGIRQLAVIDRAMLMNTQSPFHKMNNKKMSWKSWHHIISVGSTPTEPIELKWPDAAVVTWLQPHCDSWGWGTLGARARGRGRGTRVCESSRGREYGRQGGDPRYDQHAERSDSYGCPAAQWVPALWRCHNVPEPGQNHPDASHPDDSGLVLAHYITMMSHEC